MSTVYRCAAIASFAAGLLVAGPLSARDTSTFVIAAAPGYGVEDCLAEGGECGRVVADAWCEAHGSHEAVNFGLSNAERNASGSRNALRPYFITCGD